VLVFAHAEHTFLNREKRNALIRFPVHVAKNVPDEVARYVAREHPNKVFLLDESDDPETFICPECGYPDVEQPEAVGPTVQPNATPTTRMAPGRRRTVQKTLRRSGIARRENG
jgi:hypothetical protein